MWKMEMFCECDLIICATNMLLGSVIWHLLCWKSTSKCKGSTYREFLPRAVIPAITECKITLWSGMCLEKSSTNKIRPRKMHSSDLKMMMEKADSQMKLAWCWRSQLRRANRTVDETRIQVIQQSPVSMITLSIKGKFLGKPYLSQEQRCLAVVLRYRTRNGTVPLWSKQGNCQHWHQTSGTLPLGTWKKNTRPVHRGWSELWEKGKRSLHIYFCTTIMWIHTHRDSTRHKSKYCMSCNHWQKQSLSCVCSIHTTIFLTFNLTVPP